MSRVRSDDVMKEVNEETPVRQCEADDAKSDVEAPAVEALLLLQHVSGAPPEKDSNEKQTAGESQVMDGNPIHELLTKGSGMRLTPEVGRFEIFRGVFLHRQLSMYYGVIRRGDQFHFLGFHVSSVAAAHAWDLAALKRAMDGSRNLSAAKINFRLEDYVRLENILTMMVVLSFDELVEMLLDVNRSKINDESFREVQEQINECRGVYPDENGNVPLPLNLRDPALPGIKSKALSADEMRDLISDTCVRAVHNSWVKNIRDSKKWKGVYFSRDGVPYSKVEFNGKYHYLGRFDNLEGAARAYDLATLKRAMMNNHATVSLNFSADDYIKDRPLMEFLYAAESEQVCSFIRTMAQNQRGTSEHYVKARTGSKRQKLNMVSALTSGSLGQKPATSTIQHIDWDALALGRSTTSTPTPLTTMSRRDLMGVMEDYPSDLVRRNELRVERRICDANMAALLRDSTDWVRVALNAVALKMTPLNITVTTDKATLPGDVAEWFGAFTNDVNGLHAVELANACGEQSFHFVCYVAKDHCHFSPMAWNQFVDEIGLTVGDILVLLKSNDTWKLLYAVFVLPDSIMADSYTPSLAAAHGTPPMPPGPSHLNILPPHVIRPPSPRMPSRRTLQAHVMPNAQSLTNIEILQKTQDGRLLVRAGHISDPSKRGLFVIPYNSVQSTTALPPPAGFMGPGITPPQPFGYPPSKRFMYGLPQGIQPSPAKVQMPTGQPPRAACLPSAPIRLNIRGGFKALAKKTDASLFMVTDTNGQMRLVTSQPMARGGGLQPVNYAQAPEGETAAMGYPSHYFPNESRNNRAAIADRVSQTSPEITVIDPSTTGSDASGSGTEKPPQQEESSHGKTVIDLVGEEEKESETQHESLPNMYSQVTKIIEECTGLDVDIVKRYKFAFINKMATGQQIANFMELKKLSDSGEWAEVAEWIKKTVESLA